MASAGVAQSWVVVQPDSHFPIQNLPYGVFVRDGERHIGVRIGEQIFDLNAATQCGLFNDIPELDIGRAFMQPTLNEFMSLGRPAWRAARARTTNLLLAETPDVRDSQEMKGRIMVNAMDVQMVLPAAIGDYTDFYSSRFHATNVGIMFRGVDNALQPNWLHLPVGYHGRASSVIVSGTPIRRPKGQTRPDPEGPPVHGPCRLMDFEMEMAFFVGPASEMGEPVEIQNAMDRIFGMVLMNDWSARDIQKWEYVPLGPFNGKNFGTTISPWIVTMEALEPFRVVPEPQDPAPLDYLRDPDHHLYNIDLSVAIQAPAMAEPQVVCQTNARNLYWSFQQQLAHHTSTGCPVNPGDLMGSGTISGAEEGSYGSMLEICWKGTKPLTMSDGSQRKMINDGDNVIMSGVCQHPDGYSVGFGTCEGVVRPVQ